MANNWKPQLTGVQKIEVGEVNLPDNGKAIAISDETLKSAKKNFSNFKKRLAELPAVDWKNL